MSLLNKMLHDLEQRRAEGSAPVVHREIRPLPGVEGGITWVKFGVIGTVILIAAAFGWRVIINPSPSPVVVPAAMVATAPVLDINLPPLSVAPPTTALAAEAPPVPIARPKALEPEIPVESLRMSDRLSLPASNRSVVSATSSAVKATEAELSSPGNLSTVGVTAPQKLVALPAPDAPDRIPGEVSIEKRELARDARDQAERLYRAGVAQLGQGREQEALATFRAALREYPEHLAARQQIIKMLVDRRSFDLARSELEEGLRRQPRQTAWAMLLARILVDQGKPSGALDLLQRHEIHASGSAEYFGAMAAVLQKLSRYTEAEEKYLRATQLDAANGRWWIGLGMVREAHGKTADARDAYRAAIGTNGLAGELRAFAEDKLR